MFQRWGQQGGRARARTLSTSQRSAIASHAARQRWSKGPPPSASFASVRFEEAPLTEPAYLEELFSEGTWNDWSRLYRVIADRPFGDVAEAVGRTCSSTAVYGATALWQGLLNAVRGGEG